MTRILLVDDHPIVRDALAGLLAEKPDLQVVGVASSVRETLSMLEHGSADLLLADLSLEDGNAIELVRAVRRLRLKTRVLIMTAFRDEFSASEAISAGVGGYILKEQPTSDLLAAIEAVARGGTYVSPALAPRLRPDTATSDPTGNGMDRLSRREREIFRLVVAGRGSKEIANKLFISIKTVDTHRTNINRKLGVRSTASLIRFAVAHGIEIAPRAATSAEDEHADLAAILEPDSRLPVRSP